MAFAFFFLGEYGNIIGMSIIISLFLFAGYRFYILKSSLILGIKTVIIIYIIIWIRAVLPRMRYSDLIRLMWEELLPIILGWLIFEISILEVALIT